MWVAPCIERVAVPIPTDALDRWRGRPARIALTSPHAVPALVGLGWDPAWQLYTLAPTTSATARGAGLTVHHEDPGGAAALARDTADLPMILIGSDLAGAEAARSNPAVVRLVAYRTEAPSQLDLPPGTFDVCFLSPSAVHGFVTRAGPARTRVRHVLAVGATTVAAARDAALNPQSRTLDDLIHATPPSPPSH